MMNGTDNLIVNKTKYTEKDFAFVYDRRKFGVNYYGRIIFSLMIDFFVIFYSFFILWRFFNRNVSRQLLPIYILAIGLIVYFASRSIYRTFTQKKRSIASYVKGEAKCTDRTMTFVEDGVIVSSVKNGLTTNTKYGFDLIKGYISTEDCLYIRTVLTDDREIYMILHDNCYAEGSKAEAIAQLKAVGAAEECV